eukprot:TRINITY_DN18819_c0_g1_i1.p1 TRINITY_DN18819_c0_g1~~TRINITY_DN18819_c0_g1_i1.p1  ORF type:complete len:580 (+),score=70.43 TRINITY_DN18819_c0_g1_i1:276-2015(+)
MYSLFTLWTFLLAVFHAFAVVASPAGDRDVEVIASGVPKILRQRHSGTRHSRDGRFPGSFAGLSLISVQTKMGVVRVSPQTSPSRSSFSPFSLASASDSIGSGSAVAEAAKSKASGKAEVARASKTNSTGPKSADWFGAFSESESTWDVDAASLGREHRKGAYAPSTGAGDDKGIPADWFEETPSGGAKEAWQTFYPEVPTSHPASFRNPPWRHGEQNYDIMADSVDAALSNTYAKPAAWFDSAIHQYDGFGRIRQPSEDSPRRYLEWTPRSRSVSFSCGPPGCTATTSLVAFDEATELYRHCSLSVKIHATDFDDEYSRENVEWITVNGNKVTTKCDPMKSGCSEQGKPAAERILYPCLTDMVLDHHIVRSGTLNISGKISPMVDECPVDGNMLSGIATVSCMVHNKSESRQLQDQSSEESETISRNFTQRLVCATPGCTASTSFLISPVDALNKTCRLTIKINQTDFDGDHGSTEIVEWIKLGNETLKSNISPGKNPCKEAMSAQSAGSTTTSNTSANAQNRAIPRGDPFVVLDGEDITNKINGNIMVISSKISDMVDECGSNGMLFDGRATIECSR